MRDVRDMAFTSYGEIHMRDNAHESHMVNRAVLEEGFARDRAYYEEQCARWSAQLSAIARECDCAPEYTFIPNAAAIRACSARASSICALWANKLKDIVAE